MRSSCLGERKSLRDEGFDLLLPQELEEGGQILPELRWPQPLEPLNAVGDHPFPAGKEPAAGDVEPEDGDSMQAIATTRTTRSQSPPAQ